MLKIPKKTFFLTTLYQWPNKFVDANHEYRIKPVHRFSTSKLPSGEEDASDGEKEDDEDAGDDEDDEEGVAVMRLFVTNGVGFVTSVLAVLIPVTRQVSGMRNEDKSGKGKELDRSEKRRKMSTPETALVGSARVVAFSPI